MIKVVLIGDVPGCGKIEDSVWLGNKQTIFPSNSKGKLLSLKLALPKTN